ncbi:MAG: outer membrane lipoprotein chaperone LolA [Bryobacterales bacterium]|nr:outer membrane lipoprotein chaperone LolA [Bryobacterales bacterium]
MLLRLAVLLQISIFCFAQTSIVNSLKKVENRYNNIRTLRLDFEQTLFYAAQPSAKRKESGVLYLRKPGKMRWEYRTPSEKLFLSDGKDVYYYSSAANRVEKSKVKETDDMRAPLAFLIGRLDFQRDFREYRVREEKEGRWVTALPKSSKAPYREVQFLLLSDFRIGQLRVMGQDESVMDFYFRNETLNPPLSDSLFQFRAPKGAEFVDVTEDRP